MSEQTCGRCGAHYNSHDYPEHECPDDQRDKRIEARDDRIEALEERVSALEEELAKLRPELP